MKQNLSKLRKVDLRDVWGHEAIDFTTWLAKPENLDLLSEEIGIEIKLTKVEANVGNFRVDILAEEESSGRIIIIENQLEDTNHDHLGKIITYASGYNAEIIIWVVRNVREEHQRAIEWLNEHTDEKTFFFLIKIELWQIEGSNPAPKFDIIVSPNEWAKAFKASPTGSGELTDTKLQQLDFWTKFKDYVRRHGAGANFGHSPRAQHWFNVSIGSSDAHVGLTVDTRKNLLGCEIYISKNKDLFRFMLERQTQIEEEIGEHTEWVDAPIASRIIIRKEVSDIFDEAEAENYYAWLFQKTILFQKVFGQYIREFKK
jgi:hypothetical protein